MSAYSERVYGLSNLIEAVHDSRKRPQIATRVVFRAVFAMALAHLGSLNALEETKRHSFWKRWIGESIPSADTLGRVFSLIDLDAIRSGLRHVYSRMKRNKALNGAWRNLTPLILDGHESTASYLRKCDGCLRRTVKTAEGEKVQYYHRLVSAMLVFGRFRLLLDVEEQLPGEDETACAGRLYKRVAANYDRAFDIVVLDGLYAQAPFFRSVVDSGKDIIAVLKNENRDLMEDARSLFAQQSPVEINDGPTRRQVWDIEGLTSWSQLGMEVRVVRSLETTRQCRQMTGEEEIRSAEWVWVSTRLRSRLPTEGFVRIAHGRWNIENQGYNELVNDWKADHVYKHDGTAIIAFWLTIMFAYNLFHAFIVLNLKPAVREAHSKAYCTKRIAAELCGIERDFPSRAPP